MSFLTDRSVAAAVVAWRMFMRYHSCAKRARGLISDRGWAGEWGLWRGGGAAGGIISRVHMSDQIELARDGGGLAF